MVSYLHLRGNQGRLINGLLWLLLLLLVMEGIEGVKEKGFFLVWFTCEKLATIILLVHLKLLKLIIMLHLLVLLGVVLEMILIYLFPLWLN